MDAVSDICERVYVIENADATPPRLEVFPAVGELSGFARFV